MIHHYSYPRHRLGISRRPHHCSVLCRSSWTAVLSTLIFTLGLNASTLKQLVKELQNSDDSAINAHVDSCPNASTVNQLAKEEKTFADLKDEKSKKERSFADYFNSNLYCSAMINHPIIHNLLIKSYLTHKDQNHPNRHRPLASRQAWMLRYHH